MSTRWSVTVDCAEPARLASFWALALGYVRKPPPTGFGSWEEWFTAHGVPEDEWEDGAYLSDPDGAGPALSFQRVPEGKVAKNRVHLDVHAGGGREVPWDVRWPRVEAAAGRLTAAGATVLRVHDLAGRPDHLLMADPEGNEFCLL
ncbi:VOC family protein [Amycolatopsis alkalitolerans]|uniref:VOC family protein n=1 Tax=Amycolatopsis alkalitolerans TaxID=2547244 RepID=A0A5C4LVY0_9PSEU|nr:VOC family protein [Amycolatopsis alkalitolerans]TNC23552.1 VOC family protein [Amycolatopsis alkalitolerans]